MIKNDVIRLLLGEEQAKEDLMTSITFVRLLNSESLDKWDQALHDMVGDAMNLGKYRSGSAERSLKFSAGFYRSQLQILLRG
jgi:hypothetical protein